MEQAPPVRSVEITVEQVLLVIYYARLWCTIQ